MKQHDWDTEVIPAIRSIAPPGHTPGHTAFVVASGKEQLMVLSDTTNMPGLPRRRGAGYTLAPELCSGRVGAIESISDLEE